MTRSHRVVKLAVFPMFVAVLGGIISMSLAARKISVLGDLEDCAHVRLSLQDGHVRVHAIEPSGRLLMLDLKTKEIKKLRVKDLALDGTQHISVGGLFAPMSPTHYGVRAPDSSLVNLFVVRGAGEDCQTWLVDLDTGAAVLRLEGGWYCLPTGDGIYVVWSGERIPGKTKQEYIIYRYANARLEKVSSWQPDLPIQSILFARSHGNSIRIVCERLVGENQGTQHKVGQLGQARAIYLIDLETQTARVLRSKKVLELKRTPGRDKSWPSAAVFPAPSPDSVYIYEPQNRSLYLFDWKTLQMIRELKLRIQKKSEDNEWELIPFFIIHPNKPLALLVFPMGFVYLLDLSDGSLRLLGDEHFKKLNQFVMTRSQEEPLVGLAAVHFMMKDGVFMPNENQVVVVAGSGHVYIYNLAQSRLDAVFRLTAEDLFERK
jgi:hypothetical protein